MTNSKTVGRVLPLLILAGVMLAVPVLALEKVGTTSMQTLKLPLGVRGISMGNAGVASCRDIESVWWNPGALTDMVGNQAYLSQINMPADIRLNAVAIGRKLTDYDAFTVHALNLVTSDMKVRTYDRPLGTGEFFNAYDLAAGVSYARRLTNKFSLGANLRYLRSQLEEESYDGVAVDLGTLYKTDLRTLTLGMAIQNLGPDVKYSGKFDDYRNAVNNNDQVLPQEYEGASLPTMFRLGIGFDVFEMFELKPGADHSANFSFEMNHPNDNRERLNVGGEYGYRKTLFLRAGGKFAYDEESFAAGFGLRVPVFSWYVIKFDYAYSHWGRLTEAVNEATSGWGTFIGQPHRFTLGFEWRPKKSNGTGS